MINNLFYSTRPLMGPYNFIVKSLVKNFEQEFKKKVNISIFQASKILSLRLYFFFIKNVFKLIFFDKDLLNVKYQSIDLSTHILSQTYKDYRSYTNKLYF